MPPAPFVLAAVAVVVTLVGRFVGRRTMQQLAEQRGWQFQAEDDGVPSLFSLPPFVELAATGQPDPDPFAVVHVRNVARFSLAGSAGLACTYVRTLPGTDPVDLSYQVVAVHTRQALPRTIIRSGIDVYVLPEYEGLRRVREPRVTTRRGVLAVVSEDPQRAASFPLTALRDHLDGDPRLTVVADGDWVYAYRDAPTQARWVDPMLAALQTFARNVPGPPWPTGADPTANVYGAVE